VEDEHPDEQRQLIKNNFGQVIMDELNFYSQSQRFWLLWKGNFIVFRVFKLN
jgi:hypothetical protein